jgi:thiol-disulfide isomerase/thioredoxin
VTPEEVKQIEHWNDALSKAVTIRLVATQDSRGNLLSDFCDRLLAAAPKVACVKEEGTEKDLPALVVSPRIRYHAVPLGRELRPFLSALEEPANGPPPAAYKTVPEDLKKVQVPAELMLFIAPGCPHCPQTVERLLPLPPMNRQVRLAIIDGTLFPETAQRYQIRSAPTLILDDQFRWTGSVPLNELIAMMADRDPAQLGAACLETLLKEGNASKLTDMMLSAKKMIPAFLDMLVHEQMFVRLGAMVVMEELCERDPALARQAVEPLWERFQEVSEPIQGDIVHVIGETGDRRMIPKLQRFLHGPIGPELNDAVQDALDRLSKE